MGNAQSRRQHDAGHELDGDPSSSSQTASRRDPETGNNRSLSSGDAAVVSNSRKRRRDSTPDDAATDSTVEGHSRSRRRRSSPRSDLVAHHSLSGATHVPMDVDRDEAPDTITNSSNHASAPATEVSAATATAIQPHAPQSDLQQRYDAVQSRAHASSGVRAGATHPPQLDVLRDERRRARQQILEALGATPSSASTVPLANGTEAPRAPAIPPSSVPPNASASATIAALLGAAATASTSQTGPLSSGSAEMSIPIPASASASQDNPQSPPSQQQQQQRPQPARPQAFRVPLQPEMISGTSMVVQGALVARILANRPPSSEPSTSRPSVPFENDTAGAALSTRNEASTTPPPPATPNAAASTGADSNPGVPGATLESDTMRGAVTLEEQAVMLSRILGIAAAATAASLLNTSEAQHVDPSLLQTSLRRPFERMNQGPDERNERNERWLADWQRNGANQRPPSASSIAESTQSQSGFRPVPALNRRRREVLNALARQRAHDQQGDNTTNSTNEWSTGLSTPTAAAAASTTAAATDSAAQDQAARQQEIIAHLLSAAEREAASQRLTRLPSADQSTPSTAAANSQRARSSSFSASELTTSSTQQEPQQPSSLSRLIRSTIGSFLHPSRLLPSRNPPSTETQPSNSQPEGWTSASTGRSGSGSSSSSGSGSAAVPSSDFSLGPNDVAGTLRQVRNGILPDGVPGSFGSFLNHLVNDLMAAVQLMRPSTEATVGAVGQAESPQTSQTTNYFEHATQAEATSGAEVLDGETASSSTQPQPTQPQSSSGDAPGDSQFHSGEESLETQAMRQRDFQNGNLSFFRLFRFDPVAPSQLVPCIVVGVRSLSVMERFGEGMPGAQAPSPGREFNGLRQQTSRPTTLGSARPTAPLPRQRAQSEGAQASPSTEGEAAATNAEELPASRFMLFVSGGRYPPNHPLLTSNPATAGRDLMILMDLLSTMQAMQHKPSTVTQQEIDASDLPKIKGCQVATHVRDGKITENMAERCLVCLEDWQDDDDCRVLACRHAFHTACVDKWMTTSSNTCPMCRRQGVSKDGHQAGAETADSRRTAQA